MNDMTHTHQPKQNPGTANNFRRELGPEAHTNLSAAAHNTAAELLTEHARNCRNTARIQGAL
jgi:hypothetical protein